MKSYRNAIMTQKKSSPSSTSEVPFETALSELEALVRQLEGGQSSLEDALLAFERGTVLQKQCEQHLHNAKMRVEKVLQGADGSLSTSPFEA
jgi:exodeoxyribonuclease VII small subunit